MVFRRRRALLQTQTPPLTPCSPLTPTSCSTRSTRTRRNTPPPSAGFHPSGFPAESRPLHDTLWEKARAQDFAFRRLYDARSALTLTAHGVTDFATVNVKDFEGFGFTRVWNPLLA